MLLQPVAPDAESGWQPDVRLRRGAVRVFPSFTSSAGARATLMVRAERARACRYRVVSTTRWPPVWLTAVRRSPCGPRRSTPGITPTHPWAALTWWSTSTARPRLPASVLAQTALTDFVANGGGFVGSKWDGYERQADMGELVLLGHGGDPAGTKPTATLPGHLQRFAAGDGHPVLEGFRRRSPLPPTPTMPARRLLPPRY